MIYIIRELYSFKTLAYKCGRFFTKRKHDATAVEGWRFIDQPSQSTTAPPSWFWAPVFDDVCRVCIKSSPRDT